MTPPEKAARAVVERWDTPLWKDAPATAEYITALREALEQPAHAAEHDLKDVRCACCGYLTWQREHMGCIRAAYKPAQAAEPVAKIAGIDEYGPRLAWMKHWTDIGVDAYLFTAPQPARQPLTDDEILSVLDAANVPELPTAYESVELEIARAIEAAHGIGGETP